MLSRLFIACSLLLVLVSSAAADSFKVADVRVEGNSRVETASIRAVLSIRPGQQITMDDIDRDLQTIFRLGRFDDVSAELEEKEGAKLLTFIGHERPLVRVVRFEGYDELSEEKLRTLVSVKIPELYDPRKVKESIAGIRQAYVEEGYHAAEIEPVLETDERNETILTFRIEEGEKVLVDKILFEGNTVFEADELEEVMETRERWFLSWLTGRGTFREDVVTTDLDRITALYHDQGYMEVKVKRPQLTLIEENKYLELRIEIAEGEQFKVGRLDIKGDLLKPKAELMKLVTMKQGAIFSRSELRNSVLALNDLYADQGYAHVNVAPLTRKQAEQRVIDLTFDIEQGTQVHIERIQIQGNTKTRDKVIRRELSLIEGDLYSASLIRESRRRVRNLGFFDEVNVTTSEGSDRAHSNLDVAVTERPTGTFTLGVGYSSVDQFIAQGSVSQDNFLGYGVKLDLSGSFGGTSQTYRVGVTDPHFLDSDWTLGFDVYKSEREWSDFTEATNGGAIRAGYPLSKDSKGFLTYRYEQKEIFDIDPDVTSSLILDQEGESTLSSITATWTRNDTDYRMDPSTGGVSKFTLEYAGLGGTENFAKIVGDHRHFFPLFWGTVASIHGNIGYVFRTSEDDIPIDERFFLGGLRSLRGFETREVGPRQGDDFIGGEKSAYFNLEYLFPISKGLGLKGVLFFDTGNTWLESEEYFSDMRYSAGAGVRWFSPLGPLRFEWGYNLDPRDDEKQTVFEFSIGTVF